MVKAGTISRHDTKLFLVTDSIPEAIKYIKEKSIVGFGLQYAKTPKPYWGLFEKGLKKISGNILQNEDYNPE
jgi:hypothetical protein